MKLAFVIRIEDDKLIIFIRESECLPELLHSGDVGDDLVVIAAIVMRHNHRVGVLVCDIFDRLNA